MEKPFTLQCLCIYSQTLHLRMLLHSVYQTFIHHWPLGAWARARVLSVSEKNGLEIVIYFKATNELKQAALALKSMTNGTGEFLKIALVLFGVLFFPSHPGSRSQTHTLPRLSLTLYSNITEHETLLCLIIRYNLLAVCLASILLMCQYAMIDISPLSLSLSPSLHFAVIPTIFHLSVSLCVSMCIEV